MAIQVTENQAEKILLFRKKIDLTQKQFAEKAGVSDGTIKTIEKKGKVKLETLQQVMSFVESHSRNTESIVSNPEAVYGLDLKDMVIRLFNRVDAQEKEIEQLKRDITKLQRDK